MSRMWAFSKCGITVVFKGGRRGAELDAAFVMEMTQAGKEEGGVSDQSALSNGSGQRCNLYDLLMLTHGSYRYPFNNSSMKIYAWDCGPQDPLKRSLQLRMSAKCLKDKDVLTACT